MLSGTRGTYLIKNLKREMAYLTDCMLLGPITSHQSDSLTRQVAASGGSRRGPRHHLGVSGKKNVVAAGSIKWRGRCGAPKE